MRTRSLPHAAPRWLPRRAPSAPPAWRKPARRAGSSKPSPVSLGDLKAATTHAAACRCCACPKTTDDIVAAEAALARLSEGAQTIVFFGTGGSSLGGQTLAQLDGLEHSGRRRRRAMARPRTRFYDNLDGLTLERALASFDLATTRFVVVSKSGGTPETMVQAVAALQAVKAAGLERRSRAVPGRDRAGAARQDQCACAHCSRRYGIPVLDHHTGIGGRFSVPDERRPAAGAWRAASMCGPCAPAPRRWSTRCWPPRTPRDFAPAVGAATAVGLDKERGIRVMVMMPYADRLGKLRRMVCPALGREPGQGRTGHDADRRARARSTSTASSSFSWTGRSEHCITVIRAPTRAPGRGSIRELATRPALAYHGRAHRGRSRGGPGACRARGAGRRPAARCARSTSPGSTNARWAR